MSDDVTYFGNAKEYRLMKGTDNGVRSICIETRPANSYPAEPWEEAFFIDIDVFWALKTEAEKIYKVLLEEAKPK